MNPWTILGWMLVGVLAVAILVVVISTIYGLITRGRREREREEQREAVEKLISLAQKATRARSGPSVNFDYITPKANEKKDLP